MTNISVNISLYTSSPDQLSVQGCREWCVQQHYSTSYSGFIVLLCFNLIIAGMFLVLFKYSDKIVHNTRLTDEKLSIILNSLMSLVFWANTLYGIYWIFIR